MDLTSSASPGHTGADPVASNPAPSELTVGELRRSPERFAEVYEASYDGIANYVHRRVGNREACEDIVSDVFLAALDGLKSARRTRAPVRFWLLRIATNRVNRWMRRERGRLVLETEAVAHSTSGVDEGAGSTVPEELRAALRSLAVERQDVLTLYYLEELSVEEVSQVLGCRPGTVKSRLSRGRAELAQELERRRIRS